MTVRLVALLTLLSVAAPAAEQKRIAVLDFKNKLQGAERSSVDPAYFSDLVRGAAIRLAPGLLVMTRENLLVLLRTTGQNLESCEGECEVDTGRRIGADYVVSGELLRVGTALKLNLRLHETRNGGLLGGAIAAGKSVDELDSAVAGAAQQLLAPLGPPPAPRAAEREPEQPRAGELSADPDVLVAYDAAVKAEKNGRADPEAARAAWRRLLELAGKNPYRAEAKTRADAWQIALDERAAATARRESELSQLRKILPLAVVDEAQKAELLGRFARAFGRAAAEPLLPLAQPEDARRRLGQRVACEGKDLAACLQLGKTLRDGTGAPPDPAGAAALLDLACAGGLGEACFELASVPGRDERQRLRDYDAACTRKHRAGCVQLVNRFKVEGPEQDLGKSLAYLEKICALGDSPSCAEAAFAWAEGIGVAKDPARARRLYGEACKRGDNGSCVAAGISPPPVPASAKMPAAAEEPPPAAAPARAREGAPAAPAERLFVLRAALELPFYLVNNFRSGTGSVGTSSSRSYTLFSDLPLSVRPAIEVGVRGLSFLEADLGLHVRFALGGTDAPRRLGTVLSPTLVLFPDDWLSLRLAYNLYAESPFTTINYFSLGAALRSGSFSFRLGWEKASGDKATGPSSSYTFQALVAGLGCELY